MAGSLTAAKSLTLQALKTTLWDCAEVLRGSAVDRTDWKAYILPLLFFKRICDVWDEETAQAAQLYGDVEPVDFPEVHRFDVPEGCHWRDIRGTPANVGAALAHAMREIERTKPDALYRVFGAADWGNREILTDEILKDLVEGLSEVSLGNAVVTWCALPFVESDNWNHAAVHHRRQPSADESLHDSQCGSMTTRGRPTRSANYRSAASSTVQAHPMRQSDQPFSTPAGLIFKVRREALPVRLRTGMCGQLGIQADPARANFRDSQGGTELGAPPARRPNSVA